MWSPVPDTGCPGKLLLVDLKFVCGVFSFIIYCADYVLSISAFLPFVFPPNVTSNERLNPDTGKLGMSYSKFKRKDLSKLGHLILKVKLLHLCILIFADRCLKKKIRKW